MQRLDGRLIYGASDLNGYLECKRLTELEGLVALRKLERPSVDDPHGDLIRRKGVEHERRHLEMLHERHPGRVVTFGRPEPGIESYRAAELQTLEAMRQGVPVIYQATFFDGRFLGHADFLRRVDGPSNLGDYHYEVADTKLALSAKPYYLVQLCNYSEHLERLQGRAPEFGSVVFGDGEEERFRLNDYMAYYRHLKNAFLEFAGSAAFEQMTEPNLYPLKCGHCAICPWNDDCTRTRVGDDHLSLVARMRRDQVLKFEAAGIARVTALAEAADDRRPGGMNEETFLKLRRQARLQVQGRSSIEPIYELLAPASRLGFELLPKPAPGDVFFDMEGDPLYEPGRALEYLFGCWMPDESPPFRAFWGTNRVEEKRAFEAFIDFVVDRRRRYPAMHVYHYASYEKSALRRLAQIHCTRENEVDDLLRQEVLVDLFAVVRQSLVISEDGYGLKKIERFYRLERATGVKKGDESTVMFERWRDDGDQRILDDIEAYNRDDCRSTYLLREWLLERRAEAMEQFGVELPLRDPKKVDEKKQDDVLEEERRSDLERTLLAGVLPPRTEEEYRLMKPAKRERYLLANLISYHRREERPAWWEYFDRCENVDRLFEFDKAAIAGLELSEDIPAARIDRSNLYTYRFPEQIYKLGAGDGAENPRTRTGAGTILRIDDERNVLELKTTATLDQAREIRELIPAKPLATNVQRQALARIGAAFASGRLQSEYPATADLLSNRDPRISGRAGALQPEHVTAQAVSSVVGSLENSYLFIQGPPGSGKTTVGSQVICDLIALGKRVAITSNSHKAIHNLLHKVEACVTLRGGHFRGRYKHSTGNPDSVYVSKAPVPFIESASKNEALYGDDYQLAGGTGWLFAREELAGKFDYLFVDEAGQISLADALAVSTCAKNVVLLGDPSQLAQVSQGRQPLHVGDSVLEHLLGERQTVDENHGIFLDVSHRMQPEICAFVSGMMYDNRLESAESARSHGVAVGLHEFAGLYFAPVAHAGNGSSSVEEADEIVRLIALLRGHEELSDRDFIVVTPYNAQRRLVQRKLRDAGLAVEVGTVDKFQGQEAAVVFYSMATSSGADLPRDMQFLFERNRFNVAISRARAASVLVCSPRLLDIACSTPAEMSLVNLLCAFAQRAKSLEPVAQAVALSGSV